MRTDELDFELPPHLIAQEPMAERSASRLMHYRTADRSVAHEPFAKLPALLQPGDLLVFNDAQVIPARFTLRKSTGGIIEGLFLAEMEVGRWRVMLKNLGPVKPSMELRFERDDRLAVRVIEKREEGEYVVTVASGEAAVSILSRIGRMPLPPYIRRMKGADERDEADQERYQTVYAAAPGSVAAPTAGLHFTEGIFQELAARGIERTFVTLHVGMGTFKPVTADTLDAHAMHSEAYSIDAAAAEALNRAKRERRRIVAIGTTATRVLESQAGDEPFLAKTGDTDIFIHPPYPWKHVGAMVTNFHLPRSTLIALVAARIGLEEQRRLYRIAIEQQYRFFSYGDAMLIE
jgi:S-adenosylmethionine:tRNA ribosyltransferase-isomerase